MVRVWAQNEWQASLVPAGQIFETFCLLDLDQLAVELEFVEMSW